MNIAEFLLKLENKYCDHYQTEIKGLSVEDGGWLSVESWRNTQKINILLCLNSGRVKVTLSIRRTTSQKGRWVEGIELFLVLVINY